MQQKRKQQRTLKIKWMNLKKAINNSIQMIQILRKGCSMLWKILKGTILLQLMRSKVKGRKALPSTKLVTKVLKAKLKALLNGESPKPQPDPQPQPNPGSQPQPRYNSGTYSQKTIPYGSSTAKFSFTKRHKKNKVQGVNGEKSCLHNHLYRRQRKQAV